MDTVVWGLELVWWLVIGIALLAVVVLFLVSLPVTRRLPALRRAGLRLRQRAGGVAALQARLQSLQTRAAELEPLAARTQARIAEIKSQAGVRGG